VNKVYPSADLNPPVKIEQLGPGFSLHVAENYEEMSRAAAMTLTEELRTNPNLLLCAATGSTPTRTYELLTARMKEEPDLFHNLQLLKLDEWGELPMKDAGTCETYLQKYLIKPLKIPAARYLSFQSQANPETECARIDRLLEKVGPIDVCVLGLGLNGHLGLNEPADALQPKAHRAELDPGTLQHSMLQQAAIPIRYGLTLGMGQLLQAKKIILLVNGAHKAAALQQLFSRRITTRFPASFLWLHPQVICFCDQTARGG
jgi:galactosamine-6-phosphate isomerase